MKKSILFASFALAFILSGCGMMGTMGTTQGTAGTTAGTDALGNILGSVLGGLSKPTQKSLIGTWTYTQPGCAFTSDNLLAQAGGEVAAAEIKKKVQPTYDKLGVKSSNTWVKFNEDMTFSASFAGKTFGGNYTYDEANQKLTMQGVLLTLNCYAKRNANGIALLFESSKLLSLLQTISALSGNTTVQTVGDLSKNYNGLRLGFDFQ